MNGPSGYRVLRQCLESHIGLGFAHFVEQAVSFQQRPNVRFSRPGIQIAKTQHLAKSREIKAPLHPALRCNRVPERRVVSVHARVDNRPRNIAAIDAEQGSRRIGLDRRYRARQRRRRASIERNLPNQRARRRLIRPLLGRQFLLSENLFE
jgi:hypothetical protein